LGVLINFQGMLVKVFLKKQCMMPDIHFFIQTDIINQAGGCKDLFAPVRFAVVANRSR
jgi:hypothetical protein